MKRAIAAISLVAALAIGPAFAQAADTQVTVPGFKYVRTVGSISEYTLESNGLTVLLMPERSAPVVTFMVTYLVGSRNEVTGTTGATHLLEHLMFKGSDAFNDAKGNSVKQYLETVGGIKNATTSLDRTNYFAVIGKEFLEGYVAIEADRMRNLWLREEDRQLEMTVVRNEFEQGENDPQQALDVEINAAAIIAHPYHHSTIGWRSDIENVPIEEAARVLRHLLLAEQRDGVGDRRLRTGGGAGTDQAVLRRRSRAHRSRSRRSTRPSPSSRVNGASRCAALASSASSGSRTRALPAATPTTRR